MKGTSITGLLGSQGENSINSYFIMVPLRKRITVWQWYSKTQLKEVQAQGSGA